MIQLHTLGDSLIRVGEREIRPTAPLLFAALLYLGVERGRRVSRTALQELLFPEAGERSGAHSMRQLLYKLRQLGVPLEGDATTVVLPAAAVRDEAEDVRNGTGSSEQRPEDGGAGQGWLEQAGQGVLPAYEPELSDGFARWLDEVRSVRTAHLRTRLLAALATARERADRPGIDRAAAALLRIDPLNEEATLARAEALALGGQKQEAIRLLEDYSAEVGRTSKALQVQPEVLRRRIAERFDRVQREPIPLIGRQDELAWLLAQFDRAAAGTPTISILWGDAGVGKTRLVEEFAQHLLLKASTVQTASCQPHDIDRPLGALIDLVPRLMEEPGALGVSPESMAVLRRFSGQLGTTEVRVTQPPELITARIREAVLDLLMAVSGESPLMLGVEDVHWLDTASIRLLLDVFSDRTGRIQLVLTYRHRPKFPKGLRLSEHISSRQLDPISPSAATELFDHVVGNGPMIAQLVRESCVSLSAGNPLFLCTLAEHVRSRGSAPVGQATVADLLRQRTRMLEPSPLLLLRFIAALGNDGTLERLVECTGMALDTSLLALQELADRRLVVSGSAELQCSHQLLAVTLLEDTPKPIRTTIYARVAMVLEADGVAGKQAQLLWACAECWRLAGKPERSAVALRRCAAFALELGQPMFACAALERAQDVCEDRDMFALLEESIVIADDVSNYDLVSKSCSRLRSFIEHHSLTLPAHHCSELAAINAKRRSGQLIVEHNDRLHACALDPDASVAHRVRAARLFLINAELMFARDEALVFYSELDGLRPLLDPFEHGYFEMFFHMSFGNMSVAAAMARETLGRLRHLDLAPALSQLILVTRALYQSGEVDLAIQTGEDAASRLARFGLHSVTMLLSAMMSDYYDMVGDIPNSRRMHRKTEELYLIGCKGADAFYLVNSVTFQAREGQFAKARADLTTLSDLSEATTPQALRTLRALEVMIAHHEGTLTQGVVDMRELEELFEFGRHSCEHHTCALAFLLMHTACGKGDHGLSLFRSYAQRTRRDRYSLRHFLDVEIQDPNLKQILLAESSVSAASVMPA